MCSIDSLESPYNRYQSSKSKWSIYFWYLLMLITLYCIATTNHSISWECSPHRSYSFDALVVTLIWACTLGYFPCNDFCFYSCAICSREEAWMLVSFGSARWKACNSYFLHIWCCKVDCPACCWNMHSLVWSAMCTVDARQTCLCPFNNVVRISFHKPNLYSAFNVSSPVRGRFCLNFLIRC